MIVGDFGGLKFPDICLTGKENPEKNLTQETCPDQGSNPGPLRDKHACYHFLHSGGPYIIFANKINRQTFITLECVEQQKINIFTV